MVCQCSISEQMLATKIQQSGMYGKGVLVFPDIIVSTLAVQILEPFKTSVRHVLLILRPADPLVFKHVHDGRDIFWDRIEIVVVHTKVFSSNAGDIIGFTWMRGGVIVAQNDALFSQPRQIGW